MFVVMRLEDFNFEPINCSLPVSVDVGKAIGLLPVYATLEDAKEEYPDAKYLEIREVKEAIEVKSINEEAR